MIDLRESRGFKVGGCMVMIDAEFRRQEGRFARHGRVAAPGIPAGTTNRPGAAARTRLEGGTVFRAVGDWERLCRAAGALNVYSPYGNLTILNPNFTLAAAGTTPLVDNLYQGMALDPVTGLLYERARSYSPSLGTWISQDPAGFVNGADTYHFLTGNPVGRVDGHGRPYRKCTGVNATGYLFAARLAIDARNFEARDVAVVVGGPDNGKYVGAIYWGFSMFWTGKTMEQVWWGMPKHAAVGPVAPGLSAPANVPVPGVSSGVAVAPQE